MQITLNVQSTIITLESFTNHTWIADIKNMCIILQYKDSLFDASNFRDIWHMIVVRGCLHLHILLLV